MCMWKTVICVGGGSSIWAPHFELLFTHVIYGQGHPGDFRVVITSEPLKIRRWHLPSRIQRAILRRFVMVPNTRRKLFRIRIRRPKFQTRSCHSPKKCFFGGTPEPLGGFRWDRAHSKRKVILRPVVPDSTAESIGIMSGRRF